MRIAYLSINWPRTVNSGVGQKMLTQMAAWRALGCEVRFFMHTHPTAQELIEGTYFFYRDDPGLVGKARRELSRAAAMRRTLDALAAYRPDLIYLRSGRYVYPLQRVFDIAPVVIEVNTRESGERGRRAWFYRLYHHLTDDRLQRGARGFVSVSRQVGALLQTDHPQTPVRVIANGFDVDLVEPLAAPSNPVPRLVFIGSPGNPWHGVDKLARLARRCADLRFDVVGYDHIEGAPRLPENLSLHGYLPKAGYLGVLAQADVAFGSLALHRIQVDEISPLKTRECLAYGLPMVLPYRDTDLEDLEVDWLLSIPNQEDNVEQSAQAIRDFAYRMRGRRADRAVVLDRLDARVKEAQRVAFFREVCGVQE